MLALRVCCLRYGLLGPLSPGGAQLAGNFRGPRWHATCLCWVRLCSVRHTVVPETDGWCGLYACTAACVQVEERAFALRLPTPKDVVWGQVLVLVEALGRTVRHDNGVIRSAVQVPQRIWLTPYSAWAHDDLEREYDCPVSVVDCVPDECARFCPGARG